MSKRPLEEEHQEGGKRVREEEQEEPRVCVICLEGSCEDNNILDHQVTATRCVKFTYCDVVDCECLMIMKVYYLCI